MSTRMKLLRASQQRDTFYKMWLDVEYENSMLKQENIKLLAGDIGMLITKVEQLQDVNRRLYRKFQEMTAERDDLRRQLVKESAR